jgi:hypothetical protein
MTFMRDHHIKLRIVGLLSVLTVSRPAFAENTVQSHEPLIIDFLPTTPGAKPIKHGHLDMRVYRLHTGAADELVNDQRNIAFGDCEGCVRGLSLHCQTPKSPLAPASPERLTCDAGLANGIAIRINTTGNSHVLAVKNGSKYRLTIDKSDQAQGKALKPNTTADLVVSRPATNGAGATPIYKVAITFKPSTGEYVDPAAKLELIPYALPAVASDDCKQMAGAIAKTVLETSAKAYQVTPPFTVAEVDFKRSYTWPAAPRQGYASYFVSLKASDGWVCDFDVALGVAEKGRIAQCDFYAMHFRMCAK